MNKLFKLKKIYLRFNLTHVCQNVKLTFNFNNKTYLNFVISGGLYRAMDRKRPFK